MQGPYEELRRQAAAKRDKIVAQARYEYHATLRRIKALHGMIAGDPKPAIGQPHRVREKSLTDLIREALPAGPFTIPELCDQLYENPATCKYKATSIRGQVRVLDQAGAVRKIGRRNGQIVWVRAESTVEASPFGAMTLCQIAEKLIGEFGPQRVPDLVARMKERGYRADENGRTLGTVLRQQISKAKGRFAKDDKGRWTMV